MGDPSLRTKAQVASPCVAGEGLSSFKCGEAAGEGLVDLHLSRKDATSGGGAVRRGAVTGPGRAGG